MFDFTSHQLHSFIHSLFQMPPCCRYSFSTLTAKKWINSIVSLTSGFCSLCHSTCEGLESFHFKGLFADFGQIHFQVWADVILLQAFADLKYFVCDALWSRSWGQSKRLVRNYALTTVLLKWLHAHFFSLFAVQHSRKNFLGSVRSCDNWSLLHCKILPSPPLEMLYLMPKSPLGPPGLWLAVRIMPPTAFILRIIQETAGVDMMPFWPITRWPICRREHASYDWHNLMFTLYNYIIATNVSKPKSILRMPLLHILLI